MRKKRILQPGASYHVIARVNRPEDYEHNGTAFIKKKIFDLIEPPSGKLFF